MALSHEAAVPLPQKKTIFLQKKECCAGSLEGTFIRALTKLTHAKSVLEVGMFTGTTTMAIADALPQDGKVRTLPLLSSAGFCCSCGCYCKLWLLVTGKQQQQQPPWRSCACK